MAKLNKDQINEQLKAVYGWQLQGDEIVRSLTFKDFVESMSFVNKVADLAEKAGHHPDIYISWNKVRLNLTTHDAGGLTQKDFDLAIQIDQIT
ncbi:MAG TPA: 4a-hydroxytetrahydrobiopterin dehydratase [Blastocatellia bacterium]|nr:4a-hydroxytetrahydrobiopterin dehydratase [Blastocatellia bacterium]